MRNRAKELLWLLESPDRIRDARAKAKARCGRGCFSLLQLVATQLDTLGAKQSSALVQHAESTSRPPSPSMAAWRGALTWPLKAAWAQGPALELSPHHGALAATAALRRRGRHWPAMELMQ